MKIIYIFMFVSLWSLGLFFLANRTRSTVWIGLTILLGGSASFAFAMHLSIIPYIPADWLSPGLSYFLYWLTVAAMHIYFYVLPYVYCMGGLWLNESVSGFVKKVLTLALLPGPWLLMADHWAHEPWNQFEVARFRWWDGIYVAAGSFGYILAYFKEKSEAARRRQWRTFVLPLAMLWAYTSDYIGFEHLELGWWSFHLESNGMWEANFIMILGTVGFIIFYIARSGFLGIKLRIERERIDYSIRTLTMGVSILNHSIKNEIQKIDYLAEKSRVLLESGQSDKAAHTIAQVHGLTAHLLHMVNRIKDKAEDVVLQEGEHDIRQLIESVVASAGSLIERRPATITERYDAEGRLYCDSVHVAETLSNLIRNALDALPASGGGIELHTASTRREFRITVQDNGAGIPPEHLAKIFEPFFTTKKHALNYGLGLSYCTSVMSKHGGRLSVAASEPGKGTTIVLHFPYARFKPLSPAFKRQADSRTLDQVSPF